MDFIVTCGTSQTGKFEASEVLTQLKLDLKRIGYSDLLGSYLNNKDHNADDENFEKDANGPIRNITDMIVKFMDTHKDNIPIGLDTNPLGAELSTIHKYLADHQLMDGNKSDHYFHILRSDTYRGWFNSMILKETISGMKWGNLIGPYLVNNLREKPDEARPSPIISLSSRLTDIINIAYGRTGTFKPAPIIIMTGSFKSLIPCLTMYSLIFSLPLVYLFEESDQLVETIPAQETRNAKKSKEIWSELSKLEIAKNIPWLQNALDLRKDKLFDWVG
jgi:hypothetical protein